MILNLISSKCLETPYKHETVFQIHFFYWLTEKMIRVTDHVRRNDVSTYIEHGDRYVGAIVFGCKDDVGSVSLRWKL